MKHYRIMHIGLVDDFVQKILNDMVPLVASESFCPLPKSTTETNVPSEA